MKTIFNNIVDRNKPKKPKKFIKNPNPIKKINAAIKRIESRKNPHGAAGFQPILKQYNSIQELRQLKRNVLSGKVTINS